MLLKKIKFYRNGATCYVLKTIGVRRWRCIARKCIRCRYRRRESWWSLAPIRLVMKIAFSVVIRFSIWSLYFDRTKPVSISLLKIWMRGQFLNDDCFINFYELYEKHCSLSIYILNCMSDFRMRMEVCRATTARLLRPVAEERWNLAPIRIRRLRAEKTDRLLPIIKTATAGIATRKRWPPNEKQLFDDPKR